MNTIVKNIKTGKEYHLVKSTDIKTSEEQFNNICKICNEPPILLLFKGLESYPRTKAIDFVSWANEGWNHGSFFVFLVVNPDSDLVVGAVDIKSTDSDAEIGYWCSYNHRGLIRNCIEQLKIFAKDKGYRSLFANPINDRSVAVLEGSGFSLKKDCEKVYEYFL